MKFGLFVMLVLVFGVVCFSFVEARELTQVEEKALFDIFVEIPTSYHVSEVEGNIIFTLKLVNLGSAGRIDVYLEYGILDIDGNAILSQRETVAIETQASFLREFDLNGISVGNYEIYAKLIYSDGREADGRHSFVIRRLGLSDLQLIGSGVLIVLMVLVLVFLYPRAKLVWNKIKIRFRVRKIILARGLK